MRYIGFDCATKTFAFSVSEIKLDYNFREEFVSVVSKFIKNYLSIPLTVDIKMIRLLISVYNIFINDLKSFIKIIDGAVVDLIPGVPDAECDHVDRVKALNIFCKNRVMKYLTPESIIIVENQMDNIRSNIIANALVAIFIESDVKVIDAKYKNKIKTCPDGDISVFRAKYVKTYDANKAHAKFNFDVIEKTFGTSISKTTAAARGHIADSFMQCLAYAILLRK